LVKNLALSACISVGTNPEKAKHIVYDMGVVPNLESSETLKLSGAKVFLDGNPIGYTLYPENLVEEMREARRKAEISSEVNIAHFTESHGLKREVSVICDGGRVRRPLIIVKNGVPELRREHVERILSGEWTWENLVGHGI
jgi:DNA-directed RNA polymerase subunit B